ncbi:MAG: helix-turn-helix transcriptional regulator [Pseudomonadota bacterium]
MDDFASTALYDLIASRLEQVGMPVRPSMRFEGKTERSAKARLLGDALATLGAAAVIAVGEGIRCVEADPTVAVLRRADSSAELLSRWQRLERYYHGKHRVRILAQGERSMILEHYSTRGASPSAGEDLVVAGLLAALLKAIGCRGLTLAIGPAETRFIDADVATGIAEAPAETSTWYFSWQAFEQAPPAADRQRRGTSTAERLSLLIGNDLGRSWRRAGAAAAFGTSPRSLQRVLAREGTTFQQVLRTVRAEQSAVLLSGQRCKLAEAGYACGFADQAHFSRDFKLRFNMSPAKFAEIAAAS